MMAPLLPVGTTWDWMEQLDHKYRKVDMRHWLERNVHAWRKTITWPIVKRVEIGMCDCLIFITMALPAHILMTYTNFIVLHTRLPVIHGMTNLSTNTVTRRKAIYLVLNIWMNQCANLRWTIKQNLRLQIRLKVKTWWLEVTDCRSCLTYHVYHHGRQWIGVRWSWRYIHRWC